MSSFDVLTSHPVGVIKWLEDPTGVKYQAFLTAWLEETRVALEKATGEEAYRLQGEVRAIRRLVNLKEELRNYRRDVSDGKYDGKRKGD